MKALMTIVSLLPLVGAAAPYRDVPDWSATGTESYGFFGEAIAIAGDVDGDGFDDVLVGAPNVDETDDLLNSGRTFLWRGSGDGLAAEPSWQAGGGV